MGEWKTVLITGGAGFIGSALARWVYKERPSWKICVLDALTYAGSMENLSSLLGETIDRFEFIEGDIRDFAFVSKCIKNIRPDLVFHLAAESHVDNSIEGPRIFVETNVLGTFHLLEATRAYWNDLSCDVQKKFRFVHVSTDEVFGSLGRTGYFTEETPYDPSSPYSASKAGSDHLARAWHRTYGLPVIVTNCSNNYGPHQFPEKLIPVVIKKALDFQEIPVYGKGENVRDWLYVDDHCRGLWAAYEKGKIGESYNFGGRAEYTNMEVVETICDILDKLVPTPKGSRRQCITFVADRPGHDFRYAMDISKVEKELDWHPQITFQEGLQETVEWYLSMFSTDEAFV